MCIARVFSKTRGANTCRRTYYSSIEAGRIKHWVQHLKRMLKHPTNSLWKILLSYMRTSSMKMVYSTQSCQETPQPMEPEETDEEVETSPEENGSEKLLYRGELFVVQMAGRSTTSSTNQHWRSFSEFILWKLWTVVGLLSIWFYTFTISHEELTLSLAMMNKISDNLSSKDLGSEFSPMIPNKIFKRHRLGLLHIPAHNHVQKVNMNRIQTESSPMDI